MEYLRCSGLVSALDLEVLLISILVLLLVLLVAWKFFTNKQSGMSTDLAIRSASQSRGVSASKDFCSGEGIYCIYEEYAMF